MNLKYWICLYVQVRHVEEVWYLAQEPNTWCRSESKARIFDRYLEASRLASDLGAKVTEAWT
jgi:hypothetical protein